MAGLTCSQCGAPVDGRDEKCPYCGSVIERAAPIQPAAPAPMAPTVFSPFGTQPQQGTPQNLYNADGINMSWPIKSKTLAGILAIFLGAFGVHKFYLGKTGAGVMYLVLAFTGVMAFIPAVLGIVEGITYLTQNDHNFQVKNQVRIR